MWKNYIDFYFKKVEFGKWRELDRIRIRNTVYSIAVCVIMRAAAPPPPSHPLPGMRFQRRGFPHGSLSTGDKIRRTPCPTYGPCFLVFSDYLPIPPRWEKYTLDTALEFALTGRYRDRAGRYGDEACRYGWVDTTGLGLSLTCLPGRDFAGKWPSPSHIYIKIHTGNCVLNM